MSGYLASALIGLSVFLLSLAFMHVAKIKDERDRVARSKENSSLKPTN
ncbi:MAG: hypothetical protein AB1405_12105 [Bdellovibrionota bacterium]